MKKIAALIVALVLVMGLSVTAFAVESPAPEKVYNVVVINGIGASKVTVTVKSGETTTLTADDSKGTFNSWMVYKADGTKAIEGTDFVIKGGSLTDKTFVIEPLTDLIVTGNYNGKTTDPKTGNEATPTSPASGDFAVLYMGLILMAAAACGFAAKKQLSK